MKFQKLIKEICEEENITYQVLSKDYLISLTKGNVTKYIWGHKFPLNDHAVGNIIDDKYALYVVCKNNNIPVINHKILWNPNSKLGINTNKLIRKYFYEFNSNVVIKPNNGSKGIGVCHIQNENDLLVSANKLFLKNYSISICPYYEIKNEYRVVILDNEVKLIYEKNKPRVIGNGINTIKELLTCINKEYFAKKDLDADFNCVLKKGEVYEYDWHFNLSRGATANFITNEELKNKIIDLAILVTKTVGARFVSVDIINCNNSLYVMEVNSGVCINKVCNFIDQDFKITKEIYRDAINKMFA